MTRRMRVSGLGSPTTTLNSPTSLGKLLLSPTASLCKRVALVAKRSVRVYRSVELGPLVTLLSGSPFLIYDLDNLVTHLDRRNIRLTKLGQPT